MSAPPSPCTTSRTPLVRTPIATRVTRAHTANGDVRSPMLDSAVYTLESLDESRFRHPALQQCETQLANMVLQLESKNAPQDGAHRRGSSVGVRYENRSINSNGTVPDLRTLTELVKTCGQTMRRASTAVGDEVSYRRASHDLRHPHQIARSVTLKPRRRHIDSPLRATMGASPSPGPSITALSQACSVSLPNYSMSVNTPSGRPGMSISLSGKPDALSRTLPSDLLQNARTLHASREDDGENTLSRQGVVRARPLAYSISTSSPLSLPSQSTTTGYPQRLTTSTASHAVERLSPRPRPYVTTTSSRSPLVPMRASPPATPSAAAHEMFRDLILTRSATLGGGIPIAVPTA